MKWADLISARFARNALSVGKSQARRAGSVIQTGVLCLETTLVQEMFGLVGSMASVPHDSISAQKTIAKARSSSRPL